MTQPPARAGAWARISTISTAYGQWLDLHSDLVKIVNKRFCRCLLSQFFCHFRHFIEMSTTNCVIKVCSNNYYTVIKWIERHVINVGAAQLRLFDVGPHFSCSWVVTPVREGPEGMRVDKIRKYCNLMLLNSPMIKNHCIVELILLELMLSIHG